MPDISGLVKSAVSLRQMAPELWEQFVHEMRVYSASVNADLIRCAPELLPRAQGMAIQANELAMILKDAPQILEKMGVSNGRRNHDPRSGHFNSV